MSAPFPEPLPAGTPGLRLFFALWPRSGLRETLARHQAVWQWEPPARPTPASKLHLTVLFMKDVDADRVGALLEAAHSVSRACTGFGLLLDRAAVWRHGGIAHLAPGHSPAGLRALHDALAAQVTQIGIPYDGRPFAPHVTLGRRAGTLCTPTRFTPIRWPVRDFALVQSVLGEGRYAVLGRWRLLRSIRADAAQG